MISVVTGSQGVAGLAGAQVQSSPPSFADKAQAEAEALLNFIRNALYQELAQGGAAAAGKVTSLAFKGLNYGRKAVSFAVQEFGGSETSVQELADWLEAHSLLPPKGSPLFGTVILSQGEVQFSVVADDTQPAGVRITFFPDP